MRQPLLDLQALRSLATGVDLASFAKAADQLGRSTSAISAQLKKLEDQVGERLLGHLLPRLVKKHKRLLLVHARTPLGIFKDSLSHSTPAGQHLNGRPKVALRPWLPGPLYSSM